MLFLAQAATSPATPSTGAPPPPALQFFQSPMIPIAVAVLLMYFLMMRSKTGETKKRDQMLSQLKKNDRIQTIGGILGTVIETRDNEVVVKVDEASNTKMRFVRSAIQRVVVDDKTDTK